MGEAFQEHMKMARRADTILHRLRVRGGRLLRNPGGRWVIETGAALDLSEYCGGIASIDQTLLTVTIAADLVVFGSSSASSAATVVSVGGTSAAKHYVYAYGTLNPLAISISPVSAVASSFPYHAVNQWKRPLYEVYVDSGTIVVNRIMHLGLIDLTSFYGP